MSESVARLRERLRETMLEARQSKGGRWAMKDAMWLNAEEREAELAMEQEKREQQKVDLLRRQGKRKKLVLPQWEGLEESLRVLGDLARNETRELAFFLDNEGKLLTYLVGVRQKVEVWAADIPEVKGSHMIHNHPRFDLSAKDVERIRLGAGYRQVGHSNLSLPDLLTACHYGLASMTVVMEGATFSLRPGHHKDGTSREVFGPELKRAFGQVANWSRQFLQPRWDRRMAAFLEGWRKSGGDAQALQEYRQQHTLEASLENAELLAKSIPGIDHTWTLEEPKIEGPAMETGLGG